MSFLKLLWKRFTLLCILALTALPLMLIGWSGRKTLYSEYELNPLRQPGLTLVFEGIHDGVFPWQNLIKSRSGESDDGNKDEDGASDSSSADDAAAAGITAGAASTASEGQSAAEPPAYTEAEDAGAMSDSCLLMTRNTTLIPRASLPKTGSITSSVS